MKNFAEFLVSKGMTEETMKTKSAEEVAGLYNEYNDIKRTEIDAAIKGKASKDAIVSLQAELLAVKNEQMNVLKEHGIALKKLNDGLQAENLEKLDDRPIMTSEQVLKELTDAALAQYGVQIKSGYTPTLADKHKAVELMGLHHKLFTDKVLHEVDYGSEPPDELRTASESSRERLRKHIESRVKADSCERIQGYMDDGTIISNDDST